MEKKFCLKKYLIIFAFIFSESFAFSCKNILFFPETKILENDNIFVRKLAKTNFKSLDTRLFFDSFSKTLSTESLIQEFLPFQKQFDRELNSLINQKKIYSIKDFVLELKKIAKKSKNIKTRQIAEIYLHSFYIAFHTNYGEGLQKSFRFFISQYVTEQNMNAKALLSLILASGFNGQEISYLDIILDQMLLYKSLNNKTGSFIEFLTASNRLKVALKSNYETNLEEKGYRFLSISELIPLRDILTTELINILVSEKIESIYVFNGKIDREQFELTDKIIGQKSAKEILEPLIEWFEDAIQLSLKYTFVPAHVEIQLRITTNTNRGWQSEVAVSHVDSITSSIWSTALVLQYGAKDILIYDKDQGYFIPTPENHAVLLATGRQAAYELKGVHSGQIFKLEPNQFKFFLRFNFLL